MRISRTIKYVALGGFLLIAAVIGAVVLFSQARPNDTSFSAEQVDAPAAGDSPFTAGSTIAALPKKIDFNRDIRPVLANNCFPCHGPAAGPRKADLRLDVREEALTEREGIRPIVPGDIEKSEVVRRITHTSKKEMMPPPESKKSLKADEIERIKQWIAQGAEYTPHWSFIAPKRPELPQVSRAEWPRNAIDRFILARLEAEGLAPSPETDPRTLIRRVSFDLTGLPPTLEEVDAFLADSSSHAYETVVDRLLASVHYGEHMARFWLDAARYADTHGLHFDNYREIWPYRDWVIRAFNNNMPFDQFTIEQLAGDLLDNSTLMQKVATGFCRAHVTTNEGGVIKEEVFVRNVVDRVETTGTVFLGLTLGCATCHDHKFDPISQKDFYQIFAFFNNLDGNPMDGNKAQHAPIIKVPSPEQTKQLADLRQQITALDTKLKERAQRAEKAYTAWEQQARTKTDEPQPMPAGLIAHFPLDFIADGKTVANLVDAKAVGRIGGKSPATVPGKHGGALRFNGRNFVFNKNIGDFERNQAFSYGAWAKVPKKHGSSGIVTRMDDKNANRGWDLLIAGSKAMVHIVHKWPKNAIKVTTKKRIPVDKWTHFFVTYDGSSKAAGVKIYINGKSVPVKVDVDKLKKTIRTDKEFRIGRRNPGSGFKGAVDEVRIYDRALSAVDVARIADKDLIRPILVLDPAKRTPRQKKTLREHYLNTHDKPYKKLAARRAKSKSQEAGIDKKMPTTLIWKERDKPRDAFLLERGQYDQRGEKVSRATPKALPPLPEGAPLNRLGFAQWLVHPSHPLTARVAANRFWQQCFGTGIVKTAEDFGAQGEWPSHPDLLDWLAVDFRENKWDVKRLMKLIVRSAAYRQSSRITPEGFEKDPENRLLARGPRFRLDAEMLRDQALAVSGLLVRTIGGPSVKPPQPAGLWYAVGYSRSNTVRFKKDSGPDKVHRRSLYTFWKRTAPAPQMITFDAPSRESCTVRRERTNTPLQALLLLNDPQYVEAARHLAQRILKEGGKTADQRLSFAFRLVTARSPNTEEIAELRGAYESHLGSFRQDAKAAQDLIEVGESKPDESLDAVELAAWTMIANLILNLDEVINKG